MIQLNFTSKTLPNPSLQIEDLVYYVSNPTAQFAGEFITADTNGVSTHIYIGVVCGIEVIRNSGVNTSATSNQNGAITGFRVFVEQPLANITNGDVIPSSNDFIFFVKNSVSDKKSLLGYYSEINFVNDSLEKAELFAVNCDVTESSK